MTEKPTRTHPESIFVYADSMIAHSDEDKIPHLRYDEFVPAAAYLELKAKLETAEYSANGFESLYDAAYKEIAELKTQLANAWSSGYVAGQEVAKDGEPKRNPFANIFATDEVSR